MEENITSRVSELKSKYQRIKDQIISEKIEVSSLTIETLSVIIEYLQTDKMDGLSEVHKQCKADKRKSWVKLQSNNLKYQNAKKGLSLIRKGLNKIERQLLFIDE